MYNFAQTKIWHKSKSLMDHYDVLTRTFPFVETFQLSDQLLNTSVLLMSYIAKGIESSSANKVKDFFRRAYQLASRLRLKTLKAYNKGYISRKELEYGIRKINDMQLLIKSEMNRPSGSKN